MENVYLGFANEFGLKYLMPESVFDSGQMMQNKSNFPDCIAFWSVLDSESFAKIGTLLTIDRGAAWNFLATHATRFGRLT